MHRVQAPIRRQGPDIVIYTDASKEGWGAYIPSTEQKFGGRWTDKEQGNHINVLELLAVLFTLRSVAHNWCGRHVRIMTDNTTTMRCTNAQGSTKSASCNEMARQIWGLA